MKITKPTALAALTALAAVAALAFAVSASGGKNGDGNGSTGARLGGYQEVPSISTNGRGTFTADLKNGRIDYRLTYSNLEGPAQQAHIHFAQRGVNGAVVAFLCGGGGKPACPASGPVTGTILAADIIAVPAQGIAAGEIAELIRAIRAGTAYVNVHTTVFGGGEIRGQIGHARGRDGDNDRNGKKGDGDD